MLFLQALDLKNLRQKQTAGLPQAKPTHTFEKNQGDEMMAWSDGIAISTV